MNSTRLHYVLLWALLAAGLSAAPSKFQAVYQLNESSELSTTNWQISGQIFDYSNLGFTSEDVTTNSLVVCSTFYGDADVYKIVKIINQSFGTLECEVAYAEDGLPRVGAPLIGQAVVCDVTTTVGLPIQPAYEMNGIMQFEDNNIRNYTMKKIDAAFSNLMHNSVGSSSPLLSTWQGCTNTTYIISPDYKYTNLLSTTF